MKMIKSFLKHKHCPTVIILLRKSKLKRKQTQAPSTNGS